MIYSSSSLLVIQKVAQTAVIEHNPKVNCKSTDVLVIRNTDLITLRIEKNERHRTEETVGMEGLEVWVEIKGEHV